MPDNPNPLFITGRGDALIGMMDRAQLHADAEKMMHQFIAAEGDPAKLSRLTTIWLGRLDSEHLAPTALTAATLLAACLEKLRRAVLEINPKFDLHAQILAGFDKARGGGE